MAPKGGRRGVRFSLCQRTADTSSHHIMPPLCDPGIHFALNLNIWEDDYTHSSLTHFNMLPNNIIQHNHMYPDAAMTASHLQGHPQWFWAWLQGFAVSQPWERQWGRSAMTSPSDDSADEKISLWSVLYAHMIVCTAGRHAQMMYLRMCIKYDYYFIL